MAAASTPYSGGGLKTRSRWLLWILAPPFVRWRLRRSTPSAFAKPRRSSSHGAAIATWGREPLRVYLGADALPTNERWLSNLLRGFDPPDVAGTYGRQMPREWAYPMEKFYLHYTYGPQRRIQAWTGGSLDMDTTWFSN